MPGLAGSIPSFYFQLPPIGSSLAGAAVAGEEVPGLLGLPSLHVMVLGEAAGWNRHSLPACWAVPGRLRGWLELVPSPPAALRSRALSPHPSSLPSA